MKVCLLKEPITIYVPYAKATMFIESDILTREVNEIAMFILSELSRSTSLKDLERLIHVPSDTFQELIDYLKDHELLDEAVKLTNRGEMYADLHEEIECFNKNEHEVFVNLYTGELELDLTPETKPLSADVLKAPIKIQQAVRKMYEDNIDAAPNTVSIIEELIENGQFTPEFDDEIEDTLHLQLKLQHGEVWVQCNISSFPLSSNNDQLKLYEVEEHGEPFHLTIPIEVQQLKPMHDLVLKYNKELPILKGLNEELLSDKALKILKHAKKGEKMESKQLYHYSYLQCTVESPLSQTATKDFKKLVLPKQLDWVVLNALREQFFTDLNSKWQLVTEQTREEFFHIQGPFEAFFYTIEDFEVGEEEHEELNRSYKGTNTTRHINIGEGYVMENGVKRKMTATELKEAEANLSDVSKRVAEATSRIAGIMSRMRGF